MESEILTMIMMGQSFVIGMMIGALIIVITNHVIDKTLEIKNK